jgi:hypothetical protein
LAITNPGSTDAFTTDETEILQVKVEPDSSATTFEKVEKGPEFATRADRVHWRAAGAPPHWNHTPAPYTWKLPAGQFSFTPNGGIVTFQNVLSLPKARSALSQDLVRLLEPAGSQAPPAALRLKQYGFLLAAAPLTRTVRKALLADIASLPDIHMCGTEFPKVRTHDDAFCTNGTPTNTQLVLNPRTGMAVTVRERLTKVTGLYPDLKVGALVESNTFSLQRSVFS